MTSATRVVEIMPFYTGDKIRMPRPGYFPEKRIIRRTYIGVPEQDGQRGPCSMSGMYTAEYFRQVILLSGSGPSGTALPSGKVRGKIVRA